jgi:6-pyruvoyltetrahydropterin/6-carboxytetrahydropterin synthase
MVTCTRLIAFDAGHRVWGHEGKCANLHGHRYTVEVTARGELDSIGRVIDFSVLKERLGGWVERNWDHGVILHQGDPLVTRDEIFGKLAHIPYNPTAENMAHFLLHEVAPEQLEGTGVVVVKVRVWETPNCYAEAVL